MAFNEILASKVRVILDAKIVEEKKMFGSLAFMVNGKMCVAVGKDHMMCRIDPALHDEVIGNAGVRTVIMGGKEYKGYVYVDGSSLKSNKALEYWMALALDFNKHVKPKHHKPRQHKSGDDTK